MARYSRWADYSGPVKGYDALVGAAAWVALPELGVVELTGTDVRDWLQGQVTQDVAGVGAGGSRQACLCRATGQLEAILGLWSLPEKWLAVTEASAALIERVRSYVILEDVQARLLDSTVIGVFGPDAPEVAHDDDGPLLRSPLGWLGLDQEPPAIPQADVEAYRVMLLEKGAPVFGIDTSDRTLPPELGPRFESLHVAYEKGCYVGQEVLQRIHSRGHTNRTWVCLASGTQLASGAKVVADGREVGVVTRTALSPRFGHLAGAFLRNEFAEPGTAVTAGESGAVVTDWPG